MRLVNWRDSRLAYTEALSDENAFTAIGFMHRLRVWFAAYGIAHFERAPQRSPRRRVRKGAPPGESSEATTCASAEQKSRRHQPNQPLVEPTCPHTGPRSPARVLPAATAVPTGRRRP